MKRIYLDSNFKHFLYGGDHNFEQWLDSPDILEKDIALMKEANCNEMTLGIFSWALLEPQEGKFDFSFLDEAMDRISKAGGKVVLATPSGARPAWMSEKYPEVLRVDSDFRRIHHGRRHNHCYTSPVYREKVRIIDEKLAERYADYPALIAWHLSNEYGGACYCPLCCEAFRNWLKNRYGTIEELNKKWWTSFWSHSFTDWEQIEPPSPLGETSNTSLTVDWHRFVSDQTYDFMCAEKDSVRKYSKNTPVTTNFQGMFNDLDYAKHAKALDVVSNDIYPKWQGRDDCDISNAVEAAMIHDYMRSLKKRPFMIMECTPSLVNWHPYNKLKRPKMNELSAIQGISHGADTVQYFQWRKGRGGEEKFHGAVVDHVGTSETRVFKEVKVLGEKLKKLEEVLGSKTEAKVAILYDSSNRWAIDAAYGFSNADKKYMPTLLKCYEPFWKRGVNTDIISPEDDYKPYRFIISPMLYMCDQKLQEKLAYYVRQGGTLLSTYMTAMVGDTDLCHLGGFPGGILKDVFGIWNEEIDTLYPDEVNKVTDLSGKTYDAVDYCEIIHAKGSKVLAEYASDFYKGMPATTVSFYGKGKAYYIAFRDKGEYMDSLIANILEENHIQSDFKADLPYGVTAHSRTDGENTYVFLQNFTTGPKSVITDKKWIKIDDQNTVFGEILLEPYGSVILKNSDTIN